MMTVDSNISVRNPKIRLVHSLLSLVGPNVNSTSPNEQPSGKTHFPTAQDTEPHFTRPITNFNKSSRSSIEISGAVEVHRRAPPLLVPLASLPNSTGFAVVKTVGVDATPANSIVPDASDCQNGVWCRNNSDNILANTLDSQNELRPQKPQQISENAKFSDVFSSINPVNVQTTDTIGGAISTHSDYIQSSPSQYSDPGTLFAVSNLASKGVAPYSLSRNTTSTTVDSFIGLSSSVPILNYSTSLPIKCTAAHTFDISNSSIVGSNMVNAREIQISESEKSSVVDVKNPTISGIGLVGFTSGRSMHTSVQDLITEELYALPGQNKQPAIKPSHLPPTKLSHGITRTAQPPRLVSLFDAQNTSIVTASASTVTPRLSAHNEGTLFSSAMLVNQHALSVGEKLKLYPVGDSRQCTLSPKSTTASSHRFAKCSSTLTDVRELVSTGENTSFYTSPAFYYDKNELCSSGAMRFESSGPDNSTPPPRPESGNKSSEQGCLLLNKSLSPIHSASTSFCPYGSLVNHYPSGGVGAGCSLPPRKRRWSNLLMTQQDNSLGVADSTSPSHCGSTHRCTVSPASASSPSSTT